MPLQLAEIATHLERAAYEKTQSLDDSPGGIWLNVRVDRTPKAPNTLASARLKGISVESQSSTISLTLLERATSKDEQAFERIVQLYAPLVYRLCRRSHLQAADASDVVQEVFQSLFENIDRFRRDRPGDSFRGWLLTIAKNKIRDHFRARERQVRAVGGSDLQHQLQQLPTLDWNGSSHGSRFDSSSSVIRRAIKLARGDFEDQTWEAFWKTTVEGRDVIEVAQQLGVTKWVVYQAKSRVLRRMREDLDGLLE